MSDCLLESQQGSWDQQGTVETGRQSNSMSQTTHKTRNNETDLFSIIGTTSKPSPDDVSQDLKQREAASSELDIIKLNVQNQQIYIVVL